MDLLPTLMSTGWASGINAYATVAILGLLGRAGVGEVPEPLTTDAVIWGSAVMYAIEFVTDKVPFLDNAWDLVHTLVRPAIGGALGVEFAQLDGAGFGGEAAAGGGSGALALLSHGVKAGLRLGINTSPEPVSNILVSLAEDGAVAGVVALSLENPVPAAIIALLLLAAGAGLVVFLWTRIRRAWRARRQRRRERRRGDEGPPGAPPGPPDRRE